MLRISHQTPASRAAIDAELEEASTGWASDGNAVTVLQTKAANTWRNLDIEDLADYGGGLTGSGITIGPESALRVAAVFGCRRVISEDVAKLPRQVRQIIVDDRTGRKTTRKIWPQTTPKSEVERRMVSIARVIAESPCEWLTPMQFFEWFIGCAVTQRASYALPTWHESTGELMELLPLLPGAVSVVQTSDWGVEYHVHGYGDTWIKRPGEIVQLTGPLDHQLLEGYAVSSLARESIGLARAIEASQARFHKNDQRPSGVLTTKAQLTTKQRDAIRESWLSSYGPGGSGGVAILDSEFEYKSLNVTAADSQTLQNRDHQVSDICRFFRVFPQLIGHSGGLQGYGTFEQALSSHVSLTLGPWFERLEQALMKGLFLPSDFRAGYRIHIDVDAIDRGTFSDRMRSYGDAVKVTHTPNELREREGLDPIDDPAMDRVQLLANNTGMQQGAAKPAAAKPAATEQQPKPAEAQQQ